MTRVVVMMGALAMSMIGCADDDEGRGPVAWAGGEDEQEIDISQIEDGGFGGLQQSVIFYTSRGRCSGILLNQAALLTAAHCVSPVVEFTAGVVAIPSLTDKTVGVDMARIWVPEAYHHFSDGAPGEMYDLAVVGLVEPVTELETDRGDTLATVAGERPKDGAALWVNGGMDGEQATAEMLHAVTAIEPLPPTDPRYPFQLLDDSDSKTNPGDSGGPVFLERVGEPNDGMGGTMAPVVYGLVSRGGSHTRLDPKKAWIEARAADALRAHDVVEGDWDHAVCAKDTCDVFTTMDLDGPRESAPGLPHGTTVDVLVQNGSTLMIGYPNPMLGGQSVVVDRMQWTATSTPPEAPEVLGSTRIGERYCALPDCPIYTKRELTDADVTAARKVPCGTRTEVIVYTRDWAVVSAPLEARHGAVHLVARDGGGWVTEPPAC